MTRNNYRYLLAVCSVCCGIAATQAQDGHRRYDDATQLWRLTENAAGLSIDHTRNRGYAEFDLQHAEGDYRRVQEGVQRNQLSFNTERYQAIGRHLVGYGRFNFGMDCTKERAWADVMRPYLSNPFYGGSSVHGKYDTQQFDLSAAIATRPLSDNDDKGLRLGLRLDYKVGDLSRLRDPRTRSELLQYRLSPAATFTAGKSTFGLSGHYDRRKEKIPNITTVQQDPNLAYYQMTGLCEATGQVGGYSGYQREWVNHQLGAELTYGFTSHPSPLTPHLSSLTSIGIARGKEDVWGQYKFSPGQYTSYIYKVASRNRLHTDNLIHQLDIEAQWQQAYADEFRQQLIQEKDPDKGYTSYRYETQITYKKRQQVSTVDATLHYRANICGNQKLGDSESSSSILGYMGITGQLIGSTTKHLLPSSEQKLQRMNIALEGGYGFFNGHLWLDATATYSHAAKADLTLANTVAVDGSPIDNPYVTQVLLQDMHYYNADYKRGELSLKYIFPFRLKHNKSTFYLKLYGDIIKAQHSLDRKTVGLTFGMY